MKTKKFKLTKKSLLDHLGLKKIEELNGETVAPLIGSVMTYDGGTTHRAFVISEVRMAGYDDISFFSNNSAHALLSFIISQEHNITLIPRE